MIDQGNKNVYENEFNFRYGMNQMEIGLPPMYVTAPVPVPPMLTETIPPANSGITILPISRKRSRDLCLVDPSISSLQISSLQIGDFVNQSQLINRKGIFTFLGEDISMQIYNQQLEIDRFFDEHTKKMRSEMEATRRRISSRLIAVANEGIKRLKSKEDEIMKIKKLNSVLEQKVQSLTVDNQIWQQIAQSIEATSNILRRNLQQIQTNIQQHHDNESGCGSNYDDEHNNHNQRTLAKFDIDNDEDAYCTTIRDNNGSRWCRNCWKKEMCVLLLPCRHLCICTVCESSVNVCPICKSAKNGSLHVNMN